MFVKDFGRVLLAALIGLVVLALVVSHAKAASNEVPTPPPGGVTVAVLKYPTSFSWGQVLTYKLEIQNTSIMKKSILLVMVVSDTPAPRKGGPGYFHQLQLQPKASRTITFRVMAPSSPSVGEYEQFCLTVWANGGVGAFTCAISTGLK